MQIGMAVLKLLLNGGLLFGLLTATSASVLTKGILNNTKIDYCLKNYIVPSHYNVELFLATENENFIFHGETSAIINVEHSMPEINLRMIESRIKILDLEIRKREGSNTTPYIVKDYDYTPTTRILTLFFENEGLPSGNYIVYVHYHILKDNSFLEYRYMNDEGKLEWMVATYFDPIGIEELSCLKKRKLKPTFSFSVKHYYQYSALSNMPLQNLQREDYQKMQWSRFKPSIDTVYPITVALTNFSRNNFVFPNMFIWHRQHLKEELKLAHSIAKDVEQHLIFMPRNIANPEVNYVVIPDFPENCVSYWGLAFYRERFVIYNETIDVIQHKMEVGRFLARQVIYTWLDNFTNAIYNSKAYIWFNLGVAELLGQIATDKIFQNNIMDIYMVQDEFESLHLANIHNTFFKNLLESNDPLTINSLIFGSPNYKMTSILRMMRSVFSDKVFLKGIDKYFNDPAFKSGTPNDFSSAMQNALHETNPETQFDIKEVMNGWMLQKDCQMVMATRDYDENLINIWVYYDASNKINLWVPITIATETAKNFTEAALHDINWFKIKPRALSLLKVPLAKKEKGWIIVNLRHGHYRINYDLENWKRIKNHLNTMRFHDINVLNRAKLVDDAFHFVIDGRLNGSLFWQIAQYLSFDVDYTAWYPMFKALEFMSPIFLLPDERVEVIKEKLNRMLELVLYHIGHDEYIGHKDFTNTLRKELTRWSCTLGNRRCKIMATLRLQKYFNHPESIKLTKGWEHLTLCKGLEIFGYVTLPVSLRGWKEDPELSQKFVPCLETIEVIVSYFDKIIEINANKMVDIQKDERFAQSLYNNFRSVVVRHARNDKMLDYILLNLKSIKPRRLSMLLALTDIMNHVYSKEQLNKVHEYVIKNATPFILPLIESKIHIRLSEIDKQMRLLDKLAM